MDEKSCHDLGCLAPNKYALDLSNEMLNVHFGQGDAEKLKDKKICRFSPGVGASLSNWA